MRRGILSLGLWALAILTAGCATSVAAQPEPAEGTLPPETVEPTMEGYATQVPVLPDLGPAPELTSDTWINVDRALRLADLDGKVVLLEMWTFGCINCQRVIPHIQAWHETYGDQGLVVIGNHFPEFAYERDLSALHQAIDRLGVTYAVAQDNDGATWHAYRNRYWPTLYLIDRRGRLRYQHIGEGAYAETEAAIQDLLAEADS